MKTFKRVTATALIVCMCSVFFTGCLSRSEIKEQKKWVKEMNETFTDDEFEYISGAYNGIIGQSNTCACVRSKKYPDAEIKVMIREDGSLETNYNSIRYHDEVEEYITEYIEDYFPGDSLEVEFSQVYALSPVEDMSLKKYIKNCVEFRKVNVTLIRKDGDFPSDDEMVGILTDIAIDREEACLITVYCCTEKPQDSVKDSVCYYSLTMSKKDKINSISVASNGGKERTVLLEDKAL
ncbi:MAG: hypothetical protein J5750_02570 [Clostridiales bacterium]|nr:hypothetical protein [Clostridiales bacterium]